MRALVLAAVLSGLAVPAIAQVVPSPDTIRLHELQMQQDLARQRALSQELELQSLDARLRTQQAERDIQAQSRVPQLPTPPEDAAMLKPQMDASQLATIPDDKLAASNAAVRAASERRR